MFAAEKLIASIAPHYCLGCSAAGYVLCAECQNELPKAVRRCYRCHKLDKGGRTCRSCRSSSRLYAVQALTSYDGVAKDLVWRLKFDRAKSAAVDIATALSSLLADYPDDVILTHVPTSSKRIRRRGYDQSRLIAKMLAGKSSLRYHDLLRRRSASQQHGASRAVRLKQAKGIFLSGNSGKIRGRHIILVDDVITTGATLESAALTLKLAGAKRVEAIVFAEG